MDRTDWVLSNPAQIVLNGSQAHQTRVWGFSFTICLPHQVFWTSEVEEAFDGGTVGVSVSRASGKRVVDRYVAT